MSDIINLLPDHVANQIAAGEVVQRPSSVVKELLENSIDAGASFIEVIISNAGKKLIRVIDDGTGMSVKDSHMAFERHATSKIRDASELFSIQTNGFRGEALSSICAVSQVELISRTKENDLSIKLNLEANKLKQENFIVAPVGSSIAVKNLFYNVPARRNFLKSDSIELRYIIDEFHRIGISYPNINFKFTHNSSELFNLSSTNLRKRLVSIFGQKIDEKLVPVTENTSFADINGFIVKPDFSKKTRGQQFFFVNNRFIKSSFLHHSVLSSYEGLIKQNYQPGYFLFFNVNPETIDVNIHPTKTEIKFENEQSLYSILKSCIKHSLGMFNVTPTIDFLYNQNLDSPYKKNNLEFQNMNIEVDSEFNPFKNEDIYIKSNYNRDFKDLYMEVESKSTPDYLNNFIDINGIEDCVKVFQYMNKFIISSVKSGILIIHQSRAHQRILYEHFLKKITQTNISSQKLIIPIVFKITETQKILFTELKEVLKASGFLIVLENKNDIQINGIPSNCSESNVQSVLEEIFDSFESDNIQENFSQSDIVAKALARKLSIKSNYSLKAEEQQKILDDLFACKETLVSPFNKKIFINISINELEKKFNL